jgi:AraC family transcriptional regulator of adaptative response / DNA-3-methyladenine glycosylase II
MQVAERVRSIFDLGADPFHIASQLSRDPRLVPLVNANPGVRVPGIWDGFEAAVRALLGEGLADSSAQATLIRLVRRFGRPIHTSVPGLTHVFPGPDDLSEADIRAAHICDESASLLRELARAVSRGDLTFEASVSLQEAIDRLRVVPGMSPVIAEYIAMRAFREPDAFPLSYSGIHDDTDLWRPWRAYAAMYLCMAEHHTYQLRGYQLRV